MWPFKRRFKLSEEAWNAHRYDYAALKHNFEKLEETVREMKLTYHKLDYIIIEKKDPDKDELRKKAKDEGYELVDIFKKRDDYLCFQNTYEVEVWVKKDK